MVDVAPAMLVNVRPPSADTCRWTAGGGVPVAAAVNDTSAPPVEEVLDGFVVTVGGAMTVSVAEVLVTLPPVSVNTARNWLVLWLTPALSVMVELTPVGVGLWVSEHPVGRM